MKGRVLAAALACALGTALAPRASAQVSPGPLAEAHKEMDKLTACFQCHGRSGTMDDRCLACHTEIAWYRSARRGLHARVAARACASCHPDHAGRAFAMVHWDEGSAEGFRHERAGWALNGAHAKVPCRSCHRIENQRARVVDRIRVHDRSRSWLGLETACASCHADPHGGRFGATCATCHRETRWSEIVEKGFDHDRTRYPLRGRHAALSCAACHDPKTAWGPKPAFAACGDCHADAHGGTATLAGRPADCAACHDLSGFGTSTFTAARHDKTRYPLTGKHERVACGACHGRRPAGVAAGSLGRAAVLLHPRADRCERCHGDAHGGQLAGRTTGAACADCHTTAAFRPSTFRAADHGRLRLPLEGGHARAACRDCHSVDRRGLPAPRGRERAGSAGFVFAVPEVECAACHADPHAGRFAGKGARAEPPGCAGCHGVNSFRPAVYDLARHARSRFPLEGAHRTVPCALCHEELRGAPARSTLLRAASGPKPLPFTVENRRCADCHENPHGTQFRSRKDRGACEACHDLERFAPATRFDHDRDASFRLQGAHARVACERCHRTERDRSGARRVLYRGTPGRCEDCHAS